MDVSEQAVLDRLRSAIQTAGSQHAWARQHGISAAYVSDVLNGRRELGKKILEALRIERVVIYREMDD